MSNASDFIIEKGVLKKYVGSDTDVVIPEGVTTVGKEAFKDCLNIQSITVPDSVTEIVSLAFKGCKNIKEICLPKELVIKEDLFGYMAHNESIFLDEMLWKNYSDSMIKKELRWSLLSVATRCEIFATRQSKSLTPWYEFSKEESKELYNELMNNLPGSPSTKECANIAHCLNILSKHIGIKEAKALYKWLLEQKNNKKAIEILSSNLKLLAKLGVNTTMQESSSDKNAFEKVMVADKVSKKDVVESLQKLYALKIKELPKIVYSNGEEVPPEYFGYLLTCHDTKSRKKVAGVAEEIQSCVDLLDYNSFQDALCDLVQRYLGRSGSSKKHDLAVPICRYASLELINKMADSAATWTRTPLVAFRKGIVYSNTRRAMLFADAYGDLELCSKLRGYDVDEYRDTVVSNLGLNKEGIKSYCVDGREITAKLTNDLYFELRLASGELLSEFPTTDPCALNDFREIADSLKRIVSLRKEVLLEQFLLGHNWDATIWKGAFLENPLLNSIAHLLVWSQNGVTFSVNKDNVYSADGSSYEITDEGISLAHPLEMGAEDLQNWMLFFTKNKLKQPFEQIWEPIFDKNSVKPGRYKNCLIPYGSFEKRRRHGITIQKFDVTGRVVNLKDCITQIERVDGDPYEIKETDLYEVISFEFQNYTRFVNHHVAFLDFLSAMYRVSNDDESVSQLLPCFTLAQIMEFIKTAEEKGCTNTLALLMDYKNKNFADFDPVEGFTLD